MFSLGATLFHALTGKPPHKANTNFAVRTQGHQEPAGEACRKRDEVFRPHLRPGGPAARPPARAAVSELRRAGRRLFATRRAFWAIAIRVTHGRRQKVAFAWPLAAWRRSSPCWRCCRIPRTPKAESVSVTTRPGSERLSGWRLGQTLGHRRQGGGGSLSQREGNAGGGQVLRGAQDVPRTGQVGRDQALHAEPLAVQRRALRHRRRPARRRHAVFQGHPQGGGRGGGRGGRGVEEVLQPVRRAHGARGSGWTRRGRRRSRPIGPTTRRRWPIWCTAWRNGISAIRAWPRTGSRRSTPASRARDSSGWTPTRN